jgi:hypothetical protein
MQFKTRWDEFQQHEESMEHYNEMQNRKSIPQTTLPTQSNWMPPSVTVSSSGFTFDPASVEPWYPADNGRSSIVTQEAQPPVGGMMPPNITPTSHLRQRMTAVPEFQAPQPIYSSSPIHQQRSNPLIMRNPELMRRSLHNFPMSSPSYNTLATNSLQPQGPQISGFSSSLKTRFMSAFGISPQTPRPTGLLNHGQNICFVNSVIQCLTYTPRLSVCLNRDSKTLKCNLRDARFVLVTNELVQNLAKMPDESSPKAVDHTAFREAASTIRGSVIVDPHKSKQHQQDSAEFLMWFLDVLHNALNAPRPQNGPNNQGKYLLLLVLQIGCSFLL